MRTVELKGFDRVIPKLVYRLDKIGFKLRSKRILKMSWSLARYIGNKYGAPTDHKWLLGMSYIQY